MINGIENKVLGNVLSWTAIVATLIVLPWTAFDPINVPKLAVITLGGFLAAGIFLANPRILVIKKFRPLMLVSGLFLIDLLLVLLLSGNNFYQGLFGTFGRATGFVAYVSLTFLFIVAALVADKLIFRKFSMALLAAGILSSLYGFFQSLGIDFFKWVNQYSPVIGFLGNPNFQSSFIGFSGIAAFGFLLSKEVKRIYRYSLLAYLILVSYVIKETDSQQGYLVLLGGMTIVSLIWIPKSRFPALKYPSLIVSLIGGLIVTFGTLNKGPLASYLYKSSVTYRGDYWQAGWKMSIEHPFLGIGLDAYGDWYRRERSIVATLRRGPDVTSNAAHNVLLDFSSNGGFPLLIIYIAIMALVLISIIRILKRMSTFDPAISGLIAVWFAYFAQSIISLNQLGLAVWGWIISGLIIGYEINSRIEEPEKSLGNPRSQGKSAKFIPASRIAPKSVLTMFSGLIVGALLGLPPVIASSKFLSAMKSNDANRVINAAYIWPSDPYRMGQVAIALANNNLQVEALGILEDGVNEFPDEYEMWRLLSEISNASPEQVAKAKIQMKRLDPNNPTLK